MLPYTTSVSVIGTLHHKRVLTFCDDKENPHYCLLDDPPKTLDRLAKLKKKRHIQ